MDTSTCRRETEFRLGAVARSISKEQDLFALRADPLSFTVSGLRFPSGPAVLIPDMPLIPKRLPEDEFDCERWDGLS